MKRSILRFASLCVLAIATATFSGAALAGGDDEGDNNGGGDNGSYAQSSDSAQRGEGDHKSSDYQKSSDQSYRKSDGDGDHASGEHKSSDTSKGGVAGAQTNLDQKKPCKDKKTSDVAGVQFTKKSNDVQGSDDEQDHQSSYDKKSSDKSQGDVAGVQLSTAKKPCKKDLNGVASVVVQHETPKVDFVKTEQANPCVASMVGVNDQADDDNDDNDEQGDDNDDDLKCILGSSASVTQNAAAPAQAAVVVTGAPAQQTQAPSTASVLASASVQTPAAAPTSNASGVLPATQGTPVAASQPQGQGGVAGAQATLNQPKPSRAGVLGAVGNLAGASLPFTGFPLWIAVLLAVALVTGGLTLTRRGRGDARL
jgi:hypothetical protein